MSDSFSTAHAMHRGIGVTERLLHTDGLAGKAGPFPAGKVHGDRGTGPEGNVSRILPPMADRFAAAGDYSQPPIDMPAAVRVRHAGVLMHRFRVMPHFAGAIAMSRKVIDMCGKVRDLIAKVIDHLIGHVRHLVSHVHHHGVVIDHHGVVINHFAKVIDHRNGYKHLSHSVKRDFIRKPVRPRPHGGTFPTPASPRLRRAA